MITRRGWYSSDSSPRTILSSKLPLYSAIIHLQTLIMSKPDGDFDMAKVSPPTSAFASSIYFPELCCVGNIAPLTSTN
ncbi:hypothetical protein ACN42_g1057 [Penicillium freii]|uniref:Uncharacterized protein n=1 Tax=Penicillium freii TaxID=48697 RepID=A0A117NRU4_PENFR|nr:hypothetical protein ACN42_g1057 [Penicillium freii]